MKCCNAKPALRIKSANESCIFPADVNIHDRPCKVVNELLVAKTSVYSAVFVIKHTAMRQSKTNESNSSPHVILSTEHPHQGVPLFFKSRVEIDKRIAPSIDLSRCEVIVVINVFTCDATKQDHVTFSHSINHVKKHGSRQEVRSNGIIQSSFSKRR